MSTKLEITNRASDLGVGPKVCSTSFDGHTGILIMKRYQNEVPFDCLDEILDSLKTSLQILHDHGIIHNDLTLDNIFYEPPCHGGAFYSREDELVASDWNFFRRIEEQIAALKKYLNSSRN